MDVAINIEHRSDVEVHVSHHLLHFWVRFIRLQDLIEIGKLNFRPRRIYLRLVEMHLMNFSCFTSFTKYWQKAGAIHSLACIPQSIQIAFFFVSLFTPIWATDDISIHTCFLCFHF